MDVGEGVGLAVAVGVCDTAAGEVSVPPGLPPALQPESASAADATPAMVAARRCRVVKNLCDVMGS
jgi:hypothetical protein